MNNKYLKTIKTGNETIRGYVKDDNQKHSIMLLSKDEINLQENGIVGYVVVGENSKDSNVFVSIKTESEETVICPVLNKKEGNFVGYMELEDGGYIAVYKNTGSIVLKIILGLLIVALVLSFIPDKSEQENNDSYNYTEEAIS